MNRTGALALLAIPALAMAIAHGTSQARSLLPSAGRAVNPADYACFWLGQPVITVAYLAREGQSLPSPEALFGAR